MPIDFDKFRLAINTQDKEEILICLDSISKFKEIITQNKIDKFHLHKHKSLLSLLCNQELLILASKIEDGNMEAIPKALEEASHTERELQDLLYFI